MSLIPVFKVGIFNAWIFSVFFLILSFLIPLFNKELYKRMSDPPDMKISLGGKVMGYIATVIIYLAFLYSIFLPFKLGTAWFYTGLFIFLLGMVVIITAGVSIITTPINKPVTRGVYRYSRHPIYLSHILVSLGIGIATASWIILLASIVFFILVHIVVNSEEQYCKEKYGKTYEEYLKKVPRWIGIPGPGS
jgi:protein-S-isoprenylcysteine O-methyltransferase Ste14